MKIFLSYAHADAEQALLLRNALEKEDFEVWDETNLAVPGTNWHLEIGKGLERSDAMIVLLSPSAIKSTSVQGEIDYALGSARFRDRLIPVLIKPTAGVPWILQRLQFIDATKDKTLIVREVVAALRKAPAVA